jgi:hypothetical protein
MGLPSSKAPLMPVRGFCFPDSAMQWIEALINVSAFAGFIGVANAWPKSLIVTKKSQKGHVLIQSRRWRGPSTHSD